MDFLTEKTGEPNNIRQTMNDLEKYIEQKLAELQAEKAERMKNISPNWMTRFELRSAIEADIRAILNRMYHQGKVRVYQTQHDKSHDYIEYLGGQDNEN